jgi:hypothetical protein
MATGKAEGSPAYCAFQTLFRQIGPRIKAQSGEITVLYSGSDQGVPIYKKIQEHQKSWAKRNHVTGRFVMLPDILERVSSPWPPFTSMRQFAEAAHNTRVSGAALVTRDESEEIWSMLSAELAKNSGRALFIYRGESLQKSPILDTIELPVLLFNEKISRKNRELVRKTLAHLAKSPDRAELQKIDTEFRTFYERLSKRNLLLGDYDLADQLSRYWH